MGAQGAVPLSSGPLKEKATSHAVAFDSAAGRRVLLATALGSGIAFLDSTVVNVALPAIGADLGAQMSGLQWTLNGYLITLSALILLGGSLGDRYGRRRVFQIGVVWFATASLLCAASVTVPMLVAARMLQGVGGALLTPGSLAIIEASFIPADRPRAIGAWSGFTGVAAAVGPFVGGWLVDAGSWRFIFMINAPLAAVIVTLFAWHVPECADPDADPHLDTVGGVLAALGLGGTTYALIEAGVRGFTTPLVVSAGVVGLIGMTGFVLVERRSSHPMLPLGLFSSRQFTGANLVTATVYAARGTVLFLLVIYLQQALGYSALTAGAATLPVTVFMLALSARSGELAQRVGPRLPLTAGPIVVAGGLVLMVRIVPGASYATGVLPAVVVLGLGMSLTVAPLTAAVLAAADERHVGVASGVNNAVARAAQLVAVAVIPGAVGLTGSAYTEPAALVAGFRFAMLITAALATAGGILGWLTIRNASTGKSPGDRQGQHTAGTLGGKGGQRAVGDREAQAGQAVQQRGEGDLQFHPSQVST